MEARDLSRIVAYDQHRYSLRPKLRPASRSCCATCACGLTLDLLRYVGICATMAARGPTIGGFRQ